MGEEAGSTREQGIEFGSLASDLADASYPLTHEELIGAFGDAEIELQDGATTVGEVLEHGVDRTYEDNEAVRQTIFNMVGEGAVGREDYTDRGGEPREANANRDDQSF